MSGIRCLRLGCIALVFVDKVVGGNEIVSIIIVPFGGRVLKVFGEFAILAMVALMDEHSCEVKFVSCELLNRLLSCRKKAVFSDFGSITGDVNDDLIIELAIIGSSNIKEVLKPLEVLGIGHVALLPQSIEVGLGLIESQWSSNRKLIVLIRLINAMVS